MKKQVYRVTESHIRNAEKGSENSCPFALALNENTGRNHIVTQSRVLQVTNAKTDAHETVAVCSDNTRNAIIEFDTHGLMRPGMLVFEQNAAWTSLPVMKFTPKSGAASISCEPNPEAGRVTCELK